MQIIDLELKYVENIKYPTSLVIFNLDPILNVDNREEFTAALIENQSNSIVLQKLETLYESKNVQSITLINLCVNIRNWSIYEIHRSTQIIFLYIVCSISLVLRGNTKCKRGPT